MCGNNLINGIHACENNFTQNTLFREWFSFAGFMCSDYRGSQSTLGSALGGLDLQLPGCQMADPKDPTGLTCKGQTERPNVFGQPLIDAVKSGLVPEAVVDNKAKRIVFALASVGALDGNTSGNVKRNVTSAKHRLLARKFAAQSAVLLKNEGLLPFSVEKVVEKGMAVIGAAAHDEPITGGGGSGRVVPAHTTTVLEGLTRVFGKNVSYLGAKGNDTAAAASFAAKAGYAIVVLAATSSEGNDRLSLTLPDAELVEAVAKKQKNTVVVVAAPGAFLAPWSDAVPSVLAVFMSGQEQGAAVADLLSGAVSPSGKLVLTIPNKDNEMAMTKSQYPGVGFTGNCTLGFKTCYNATYSERLEVGYRWYHAHDVKPKFAFGHGLTYSSFKLEARDMRAGPSSFSASVTLKNTGTVHAAEVVQLYMTFPETAKEPPRQLRAFKKVFLSPGASADIDFQVADRDLSIWDETSHSWKLIGGAFTFELGFSSEDIALKSTVHINSLSTYLV